MGNPSPPVDSRTAADVVKQAQDLIKAAAPLWAEVDPKTLLPQDASQPIGVNGAILGIFARFAEIILERLNRVPEKNFLAFLDLLGASLHPPQPARVPLAFSLASGSTVDAVVPAGTQVAAPSPKGGTGPVLFETERPLVVTAARLDALQTRDPSLDRFATIPTPPPDGGSPFFRGDTPIDHTMAIAHDTLFGLPGLSLLSVDFVLQAANAGVADRAAIGWSIADRAGGIPLTPVSDTTNGLAQSGTIVFSNLPLFPRVTQGGTTARWLVGRLQSSITRNDALTAGSVRAGHLPTLQSVSLRASTDQAGLALDASFTNGQPVDLSKDFYPFGEKPKFGDTWYFAQGVAFAQAGATVTIHVSMTNSSETTAASPASIKRAHSTAITIAWEFWDGARWSPLGNMSIPPPAPPNPLPAVQDATTALTMSGTVTFGLPKGAVPLAVNGVKGCWARARIIGGDYGGEATFQLKDPAHPELGFVLTPASFAPPLFQSISVEVQSASGANVGPPQEIQLQNDFSMVRVTPGGPAMPSPSPFRPTGDVTPAFYLGFSLPPGRASFPNQTLSLWLRMATGADGLALGQAAPDDPTRLAFEYRNVDGWSGLTVLDGTVGFTRHGVIEFIPPADIVPSEEFGQTRYWLRVRRDRGKYTREPGLGLAVLNATTAVQATTLRNETLGSSSFGKGQLFVTARSPVLFGQRLEVREKELPPTAELAALVGEEGGEVVSSAPAMTRPGTEVWVRWHEVPDFYASGPRDRHYVLNHLTGEVRFGDGQAGLIPPAGTSNVRMGLYQTGGGSGGPDAGTVVQMKTTIPYVDKVTNPDPALGGADAEDIASLIDRVPRSIRHRGRAVAREDYEDLAHLASPAVARAKCLPLRDLVGHPEAKTRVAGVVSLIVVPRSAAPSPAPDAGLLAVIQHALDAAREPGPTLRVLGPHYVPIGVSVEVAPASIDQAGTVGAAVGDALRAFLHPLTGGPDGLGWDFGQRPHKSDLYRLIDSVKGVEHVLLLTLDPRDDVGVPEHQLICPGVINVSLVFDSK